MTQKKGGVRVPMQANPKTMTEQELLEAKFRAVQQMAQQNAQAVLYNLCGNPSAVSICAEEGGKIDLSPLVDAAVAASARFIVEMGKAMKVIHDEIVTPTPEE